MISILKVDGDHTSGPASRHPSIQTQLESIGGWWMKVSLGEWRKEIITSLHLRSSMVQLRSIMGSSGHGPGAGQRWQVMDRSRSQGQPEPATAMLA